MMNQEEMIMNHDESAKMIMNHDESTKNDSCFKRVV